MPRRRLIVIAEPRSDISVTVQHRPSRLPPLEVRREGGRIVVDGGLDGPWRHLDCVGYRRVTDVFHLFGQSVTHNRDNRGVIVGGVGRVDYADLPVITAHVPLDARVATAGAVWGDVGATRSLALQTAGWRRLDLGSGTGSAGD